MMSIISRYHRATPSIEGQGFCWSFNQSSFEEFVVVGEHHHILFSGQWELLADDLTAILYIRISCIYTTSSYTALTYNFMYYPQPAHDRRRAYSLSCHRLGSRGSNIEVPIAMKTIVIKK